MAMKLRNINPLMRLGIATTITSLVAVYWFVQLIVQGIYIAQLFFLFIYLVCAGLVGREFIIQYRKPR